MTGWTALTGRGLTGCFLEELMVERVVLIHEVPIPLSFGTSFGAEYGVETKSLSRDFTMLGLSLLENIPKVRGVVGARHLTRQSQDGDVVVHDA